MAQCTTNITNPCPSYPDTKCIIYTGKNLANIGVKTNDRLEVILKEINDSFSSSPGTIGASNGLYTTGLSIRMGVNPLIENTTITQAGFKYSFVGGNVGIGTTSPSTTFSVGEKLLFNTGTSKFFIKDASIGASSNGFVWTLVDHTTGEGKWGLPIAAANTLQKVFDAEASNSLLNKDNAILGATHKLNFSNFSAVSVTNNFGLNTLSPTKLFSLQEELWMYLHDVFAGIGEVYIEVPNPNRTFRIKGHTNTNWVEFTGWKYVSVDTYINANNMYVGTADTITTAGSNKIYLGTGTGAASSVIVAMGPGAFHVNTTGNGIAIGNRALYANTSGIGIAIGDNALLSNTIGQLNIALGQGALSSNIDGNQNIAIGGATMGTSYLTGDNNIAIGNGAFTANPVGSEGNIAIGHSALSAGPGASVWSVAVGNRALEAGGAGLNVALGPNAMLSLVTGIGEEGSWNVALGAGAMEQSLTGTSNAALGADAIFTGTAVSYTVAVGRVAGGSLLTGTSNIYIGYHAGYNGSQKTNPTNQIVIGAGSWGTADNQTTIGNSSTTQTIVYGDQTFPSYPNSRNDSISTKALYTDGSGNVKLGPIGAATTPISGLLAATATNSINNVDFTQTWNWNSLSIDGLYLKSNSTAAFFNAQTLFRIELSGANANNTQTTKGAYISNIHTGTGSVNVGLLLNASGGGTNYAIISGGGNWGVGSQQPTELLTIGPNGGVAPSMSIAGATLGRVIIQSPASFTTYTLTLPTTAGTNGYVLQTDGTGITSWVAQSGGGGGSLATLSYVTIAAPTDANLLIYKTSSSKWENKAMSGDTTITNAGLVAIGASKVTNTMLAGSIDAAKLNTGVVSNTEFNFLDGVTSAIQTQLDSKTNKLISFNTQTVNYTLVLTDADKLVEMNVGGANNITVPPNASVAYPVGTQILISQYGAGTTTIIAGAGVTLNSPTGSLVFSGQNQMVALLNRAINEWYVEGGLGANVSSISSLTPAVATNIINNANFNQEWQWNSLTEGPALALTSTSVALNGALLTLSTSGVNSSSTITTYGQTILNSRSGTASTNVCLYVAASGATNNYGLIVDGGSVGINATTPNSTLQITGSVSYSYIAKTAIYTIGANDHVINCTANTFTVTLPTAVGITGRVYIIKNSGAGTITLATTSSQNIDASTTQSITAGNVIRVVSTNAGWIMI